MTPSERWEQQAAVARSTPAEVKPTLSALVVALIAELKANQAELQAIRAELQALREVAEAAPEPEPSQEGGRA